MLRPHWLVEILLSTLALPSILTFTSPANATSTDDTIHYRDGNRQMSVRRVNSTPTLGARGQSLWPIQIITSRQTIDSFVDHKALIRIDPAKKDELETLRLRIVENLMPSIGIYAVESLDGENGLDIASRLASSNARPTALREVIPNLYLHVKTHGEPFIPNDPEFLGQWFFDDKRLQMSEVWGISRGDANTTIVVIDTGCDMKHPDLVEKLDPGLDVLDNDADPSYDPAFSDSAHGTACAGLVGATTNNSVGISGGCPNCRVRCVRLLADMALPLDSHLKAFNFAFDTKAAVVSNSWGFADPMPIPTLMRDALDNLFDNGRDGKGALVFFAAGNDNREIGDDEITGAHGVTAIGAINHFFDKTFFTNYGATLDLVAPVGTLTTDNSGATGYDPGDYTANFGGTSSACPVAAGVAGVVMSAMPDKTSAEVLDLFIRTAKVAPYASPDANGHDPVFGFGIINPLGALKEGLGITDEPADAGPDASTTAPTPSEPEPSCGCRTVGQTRFTSAGTFGLYAALALALAFRRRKRH
jgi:serine protease